MIGKTHVYLNEWHQTLFGEFDPEGVEVNVEQNPEKSNDPAE